MARPERSELEVPAAGETGAPVNVFRLRDKTVQISGAFDGSLQIEGSIDGEEFAPIGAPVTGPGLVPVPLTVDLLRIHTLALTAGKPTAAIAGFDYRTV